MIEFDTGRSPIILSAELEKALGVTEEDKLNPVYFEIPTGFEIAPIFPFHGAATRFYIRRVGTKHRISVYYDVNNCLGFVGEPYYEAYSINGDTARFLVGEEKVMMEAIINELNKRGEATK